jgi:UDP-glucose 4-epimerase
MILITGHKGFIGSELSKKINEFIGLDIQEGKNILNESPYEDVKIIYHLAAQSSVEDSWNNPVQDSDNLRMTVKIVHDYPDAKIVFAQSAASLDIQSPYGFSKWVSAEYIKRFHRNYVICTLPNVYGGSKSVVDIFKSKDEVTIYGDGEQVRDFVHVSDVADALLKAKDWDKGEYLCGSGKGTKIIELAKGKKVKFEPARVEIRESILPNTTPNWKPKITI